MKPAPSYYEWAANQPPHDMELIRQRWVKIYWESYWEAIIQMTRDERAT